MSFSPKTWVDGSGGGTPITAAELNRIEAGIVEAATLPVAGGSGGISIVDNGATLSLTPSGTSSIVDNGDTLTITA